jgi:hypothetical protein
MAASSSPSAPSPALRASDADRERVAAALRRHHVDGRLDTDELQERLGACYAARTLGDLEPLLADLPGARRPAAPARRGGAPPWAWPAPAVVAVVAVVLVLATLGALAHGRPGPLPFLAIFLLLRFAWWGPRRRTAWGPRG